MNGTVPEKSIVILTQVPDLHSVRRLTEAAAVRAISTTVIDPIHCVCRVDAAEGGVFYYGQPLPDSIAIISRVSHRLPEYGWMVLRHLERRGYRILNPVAGIARAQHKFDSLEELAEAGLAVPRTFVTRTTLSVDEALEFCGGLPIIMKLVRGSQGQGVVFVDSLPTLKSLLGAVIGTGNNIVMQQYIPEASASDIRTLILDGRIVGSIRRVTSLGEFRSNVHRGGRPEPIEITGNEQALCLRAAKLFGLRLAGVDFVRTPRGTVFLEVNPNPGFEGFERGTGIDVASQIVTTLTGLIGAG